MIKVLEFDPCLATLLPATHSLLSSANLMVHEQVSRLILHGSRGLAGGYRPDSDIDLSLIVDKMTPLPQPGLETLLHDVCETTLSNWHSDCEVDLAVIFDLSGCGLKCFNQSAWDEGLCTLGDVDCFGLYKIQKGFNGLVVNAGIQVQRMYPCLKIWERRDSPA